MLANTIIWPERSFIFLRRRNACSYLAQLFFKKFLKNFGNILVLIDLYLYASPAL